MTTYYVSKTGSDSNDGLSWETAFSSYKKAYDSCTIGDIIEFGEGNFYGFYDNNLIVTDCDGNKTYASILCDKGLTIKGQKSGKTNLIFDYKDKSGSYNDRLYILTGADNSSYTSFIDIRFEITNAVSSQGGNMFVGARENVKLYNCSIHYDTTCDKTYISYWNCESYFFNCTIILENSNGSYFSYGAVAHLYNCVYNIEDVTTEKEIEDSIFIDKASIDENYKLLKLDNSMYGVYSGRYKWNGLYNLKYFMCPRYIHPSKIVKLFYSVNNTDNYSGNYNISITSKSDGILKQLTDVSGSNAYTKVIIPTSFGVPTINIKAEENEESIDLDFVEEKQYDLEYNRTFLNNELGYLNKNLIQNDSIINMT